MKKLLYILPFLFSCVTKNYITNNYYEKPKAGISDDMQILNYLQYKITEKDLQLLYNGTQNYDTDFRKLIIKNKHHGKSTNKR